jgi:hypothetical protein
MSQEGRYNLSPGVDLDTARYLTDRNLLKEYERLRDAGFETESTLTRLWRMPKFRRRAIELCRLGLFVLLVCAAVTVITRLGLWSDIYQKLVTAL